MNAYFMWDVDGELTALGAWPCFDDVPPTPNSVWVFEGTDELQDFVDQATEVLEKWND